MNLKEALHILDQAQAIAKLTRDERNACTQSLQALNALVDKDLKAQQEAKDLEAKEAKAKVEANLARVKEEAKAREKASSSPKAAV